MKLVHLLLLGLMTTTQAVKMEQKMTAETEVEADVDAEADALAEELAEADADELAAAASDMVGEEETLAETEAEATTEAGSGTWSRNFGGGGGDYFQDPVDGEIERIVIRSGGLIDRIRVHNAGGQQFDHGGGGGTEHWIDTHNICINSVYIRTGRVVDALQFRGFNRSNRRAWQSHYFGGHGGTDHGWQNLDGCLIGFSGRSGGLVDRLTFQSRREMTSINGRWEQIDSDNRDIHYTESNTAVQSASSDITRETASQFSIEATVSGSFFVDASVTTSYATQQSLREQFTTFTHNTYTRAGTQTCRGTPAGHRNVLWRFTMQATGNNGQTVNAQTNHYVCSNTSRPSPRCVPRDCANGDCTACRPVNAALNRPVNQVLGRMCAHEGHDCSCRGTVYYLAPTAPRTTAHMGRQRHRTKRVNGRVRCGNGGHEMGGDPHHGARKMCYCFS